MMGGGYGLADVVAAGAMLRQSDGVVLITSEAGQALIRKFEGCRLTAYRDIGGVLTIGFGHTGPEVVEGLTWTPAEAEAAFQQDLRTAERAVMELVRVPISTGTHASLASFVFNLGRERLAKSTLLRLLNQGSYMGAAKELARWVYVDQRVCQGLVRRRAAERNLWLAVE